MNPLILDRPVIAVAGSSGKTTTKEMIAAILKTRWKIYKSGKNRNDRSHLKIHRRRIKSFHRAVVLEYGMSYRGNLRKSCNIIQPNMAIVTMVGTAHIGNMGGSVDELIRAKSDIILNMKQTGKLFINADDANSTKLTTGNFKGEIIMIGIKEEADYQAAKVRYTRQGMAFDVKLDKRQHGFFIPVLGEHNVYNALFAIAVADQLGFSAKQMARGLRNYHRPPHRLRVYRLEKGSRLIDDTYNANPNSVKAAVDVLSRVGRGRKIAVLGNMSELGKYSRRGHQDVGQYLAASQVSRVFTFGKKARLIGNEAIAKGFPVDRVTHSLTRNLLHRRLRNAVQNGATILVKGSHDQRMFKTVRYLRRVL